MFDNTNPYTLKEIDDGEKKIYIAVFKNGNGDTVETDIDQKVAVALFRTFVRKERNLRRYDERHIEYIDITENEIQERHSSEEESIEETICQKEEKENIYKAIDKLSKVQRRRLILYYFECYTLDEIASIEGCSARAIKYSIDCAKKNLKKFLK